MWGGAPDLLPETKAKLIEACLSVGLTEEEGRDFYNYVASSTIKARPAESTADGDSFAFSPIHGLKSPVKSYADASYFSFEFDYKQRCPPHDSEVISLLMVRAGLEWLEHLKSQGKL